MIHGELGGKPVSTAEIKHGEIRAGLIELINLSCLQHSAKIADAILDKYELMGVKP